MEQSNTTLDNWTKNTNKDTNHVRSSTISHEKIHDEFGWCGWRCSCRIHMKFPNDQFVDKVFVRKYDLVRGMNSLVNNPMLQNMQHAKHHYQNFTFFVTGQPCCYIISCCHTCVVKERREKNQKSYEPREMLQVVQHRVKVPLNRWPNQY